MNKMMTRFTSPSALHEVDLVNVCSVHWAYNLDGVTCRVHKSTSNIERGDAGARYDVGSAEELVSKDDARRSQLQNFGMAGDGAILIHPLDDTPASPARAPHPVQAELRERLDIRLPHPVSTCVHFQPRPPLTIFISVASAFSERSMRVEWSRQHRTAFSIGRNDLAFLFIGPTA
jgi:hypothetical protein